MVAYIVAAISFAGLLHYRSKYRKSVIHHRDAALLWQKMMMNVMSEQVKGYFKDTPITNHVVRLNKNKKIEILIGDEDFLVNVNMDMFNHDVEDAFKQAYNEFVTIR